MRIYRYVSVCVYLSLHSFIHSVSQSVSHSFIHSCIHSFMHSFIHSPIYWFIYLLIVWFIYLDFYVLNLHNINWIMCLFVESFLCWCIYSTVIYVHSNSNTQCPPPRNQADGGDDEDQNHGDQGLVRGGRMLLGQVLQGNVAGGVGDLSSKDINKSS